MRVFLSPVPPSFPRSSSAGPSSSDPLLTSIRFVAFADSSSSDLRAVPRIAGRFSCSARRKKARRARQASSRQSEAKRSARAHAHGTQRSPPARNRKAPRGLDNRRLVLVLGEGNGEEARGGSLRSIRFGRSALLVAQCCGRRGLRPRHSRRLGLLRLGGEARRRVGVRFEREPLVKVSGALVDEARVEREVELADRDVGGGEGVDAQP
mmetsp:Transcript_17629/g.43034  ORF Transcript_17629/g.43034 Transcript_17629/m.43034 type:complete len:209 (-) Transcript_17629:168-794(-)